MVRFYLDEHINPRIAVALRARGVEAITARDAGRVGRGIPDPMQLAYAAVHVYVFVSGDWDFLAYAGSVRPHGGVAIIPRHVAIGTAALYLEVAATSGGPANHADRLLVYPATL